MPNGSTFPDLSTDLPSDAPLPLPEQSSAEPFIQETLSVGKPPQVVFPGLWAFPPNRETLGGTSYFLETEAGNVLVDCPPWTEATQAFLRDRSNKQVGQPVDPSNEKTDQPAGQSSARWLFLTQRNAIASINRVKQIQETLGCDVVIQEQEAYLLPGSRVTAFYDELSLSEELTILWTPGFSPGTACLHWRGKGAEAGRGVLFTGRHLLPTKAGNCAPLRSSKTFHWPRQLRAVEVLRDRFSAETLHYLCPGASIGFLRGKHYVEKGWEQLRSLDLEALKNERPGL